MCPTCSRSKQPFASTTCSPPRRHSATRSRRASRERIFFCVLSFTWLSSQSIRRWRPVIPSATRLRCRVSSPQCHRRSSPAESHRRCRLRPPTMLQRSRSRYRPRRSRPPPDRNQKSGSSTAKHPSRRQPLLAGREQLLVVTADLYAQGLFHLRLVGRCCRNTLILQHTIARIERDRLVGEAMVRLDEIEHPGRSRAVSIFGNDEGIGGSRVLARRVHQVEQNGMQVVQRLRLAVHSNHLLPAVVRHSRQYAGLGGRGVILHPFDASSGNFLFV